MMKIIFLDIDGVLNTKYWYKHMDKSTVKDKYGYAFDPNAVSNLKRIIDETGANIVISSSWKCMGMTELKAMWRDRHLPGKVIGITPDYDMDEPPTADSDTTRIHQIRGLEIEVRTGSSYTESTSTATSLLTILTAYCRNSKDISFRLTRKLALLLMTPYVPSRP